jgi:hypothetical protein
MMTDIDYRITRNDGLNEIAAYGPLEEKSEKKQRGSRKISRKQKKRTLAEEEKIPMENYPQEDSHELDFYA